MRHLLFFTALLFSTGLLAQDREISTLTTNLDSGYANMSLNWRYAKGDDPSSKEPDFDDSEWKFSANINLALLDSVEKLEEKEVYWFRRKFRMDASYISVMFELWQAGALDLYLNGEKIISVGKTGREPVGNPPFSHFGFSKLDSGELYVLAIKYQYVKSNRFLPEKHKPELFLRMTSTEYANSQGYHQTVIRPGFDPLLPYIYIFMGLSIFLLLLFFGLWLYTREKTNLLLAVLNLMMAIQGSIQIHSFTVGFRSEGFLLTGISLLLALFFIHLLAYELLERQKDKWHRVVSFLVIAAIIATSLWVEPIVVTLCLTLVVLSVYRVCYLQRKVKKLESRAFALLSLVLFSSPVVAGIEGIFGLDLGLDDIPPLTVFIIPIGLGLLVISTIGRRTESLRRNLAEVERLSQDREEILASQNEKLEKQVAQRTKDLKESLENLKSTQAQLIQSEKMASLGELTAGIAHEIQNPLNFVNNFSEVSGELIEEAQQEIEKGDLEEIKFILQDLKDNLSKINHHGKRAGAIVKGMLEHSRKGEGKKTLTDLNALADEYLRLSYHGLRAKDKSFTAVPIPIGIKTDFDPNLPKVEVIPQDIGRVLLNLINNAFYAVNEKSKSAPDGYQPEVTVSSRQTDKGTELSIQDNGPGIPDSIKDKIFQPFFTTKPTGSGTGLGLSLSYDIVKAHGGEMKVESKEGEGTEMIIYLPIDSDFKSSS